MQALNQAAISFQAICHIHMSVCAAIWARQQSGILLSPWISRAPCGVLSKGEILLLTINELKKYYFTRDSKLIINKPPLADEKTNRVGNERKYREM